MSRFRPQFSLLSALLLMTVVGLAIVVAQLRLENAPLRKELRVLRKELGRLFIEDESKLHAIAVRTHDDLIWRWGVWIPEGQGVTLHSQWGNVPRTGVPSKRNSLTLSPGEQSITLIAQQDLRGWEWTEWLETSGGMVGGSIQPDQHWFRWPEHTSTFEGVSTTTYVAPENAKEIVLIRFRVGQSKSSDELNKSDEPTPGFIVWLERW